MITKETAHRIDIQLRYGDKRRIAKRSGYAILTVIRFFNGEIEKLSAESQSKVLSESLALLDERQKRAKSLEKETDRITGNN